MSSDKLYISSHNPALDIFSALNCADSINAASCFIQQVVRLQKGIRPGCIGHVC